MGFPHIVFVCIKLYDSHPPLQWCNQSGRVWRKVPENNAQNVCLYIYPHVLFQFFYLFFFLSFFLLLLILILIYLCFKSPKTDLFICCFSHSSLVCYCYCFYVQVNKIFWIVLVCPNRHGGTNVQQALTMAVELKQPVYGYPVSSLSSMRSVGVGGSSQTNRDATLLRDCVPLKPGTTVIQFFEILCNYPYKLLSGDFVRAEVGGTSADTYLYVCWFLWLGNGVALFFACVCFIFFIYLILGV